MRAITIGFVGLPAVWLALFTVTPAAQAQSVNTGVFSDAQATRGADAFNKDCSVVPRRRARRRRLRAGPGRRRSS